MVREDPSGLNYETDYAYGALDNLCYRAGRSVLGELAETELHL